MDPDLEKALAKRLEKVKVEEQDSQESGSSQNVVNETFAETSQTPTRLPSNAGQFAKFGTKAFPGQREVVNLFPLFLILLLLVYIFYVFQKSGCSLYLDGYVQNRALQSELAEKDAKVMELERKLVEREQLGSLGAEVGSRGQSQASIPSASEQEGTEICSLPTQEGGGVSTEERIGLLLAEGGCLPCSEEARLLRILEVKMIEIAALKKMLKEVKELLAEHKKVAKKKERLNSEALTLEKRLGSEALAAEKRLSSEALTAKKNELQTRIAKLREAAMAQGMVSQTRIS